MTKPVFRTFNFLLVFLNFAFCLLTFFPTPAFAANSGIFSMELWVKPTSSVASQALVGKAEEMRMFTDASGNPGCQIKTTTWQTAVSSSTAITLNTWSFVACTYDKVNLKIYVNGVQTGSQALTTAPDDTANSFKIGQDDSSSTPYSNLTGTVDQFQVYNYARTTKQITEDMGTGAAVIASGAKQSGPVGYWKFDEGVDNTCSGGVNDACNSGSGGSALDGAQSGMSVPATATSGWTQAGKFGKALIFDGSNDYIAMPSDVSALKITSDITLSAWINLTDTSSQHDIICKYTGTAATSAYCLNVSSAGKLVMQVVNSTGPAVVTTTGTKTLSSSTWYHVLGVLNTTLGSVDLYVNGVLDKHNTTSIPTALQDPTTILDIGAENAGSNLFTGTIDEPKIYNYALTADEVKTEYNRSSSMVLGSLSDNSSYQKTAANQEYCVPGDATSCAAPVGRWDFEEGKDNTCSATADVCDRSGNANNGTWYGTGSHWTDSKTGLGKAGKFNGSDDYVNAGLLGSFGSSRGNGFTIEGWVKLNTNTSIVALLGGDDNLITGQNGLSLRLNAKSDGTLQAGSIRLGLGSNELSPKYLQAATNSNSIATGVWKNLAITVTPSTNTIAIYVDGVSQTVTYNNQQTPATFANFTNAPAIGAYNAAGSFINYFNGQIDQVRIFNYARSAAQIAWDYNRGAPVGYWKMDDCQGTTIHDSSGNNNSGTITVATGNPVGTCTTSNSFWGGTSGTGAGKRNYAPTFDGTDDKVTIGTAITGIQSVAFWVKPATSTDSFMDLDGGTHYITSSSGVVSATGFSSPTIYVNGVSGGTLTGGAWNHVVITTGTAFNSTTSFTLGYKSVATADYLNGQLDDVRVYNYALTGTQVKDVYNNGAVNFGPSTGAP